VALPVRYVGADDHEELDLTIHLSKPISGEAFQRLKHLIDSWFEVGFYGGYGGQPESGFEAIHDIEYDEQELWISWSVDAHHLPTSAVAVLAEMLDGFNQFGTTDQPSCLKELLVGFIVEA